MQITYRTHHTERQRKGYENLTFADLVVDDETKLLTKKVFRKQEQLGQTAFLQGYISGDWSLLQNAYDGAKDVSVDRIDWTSKIIKHIWIYSTTLWKDRCDEIHGVNEGKTKSIKRKELLTSIKNELERTGTNWNEQNFLVTMKYDK